MDNTEKKLDALINYLGLEVEEMTHAVKYIGISGMVGSQKVCEVMAMIAENAIHSSVGGFEKNLVLPNGFVIHGFVFWATIPEPSKHDLELLKELTEYTKLSTELEAL